MKLFSRLLFTLALLAAPLFGQVANSRGGYVNFLAPENVVNWANNNSTGACLYRVGPLSATLTGSSFTPLATIYSDGLFANVISQASGVTCPANGRIKFFAPFGTYVIQYQFTSNAGSQFFNDTIQVGPGGSLGNYQGVASVGITDTNFHALVAAASDILVPANTLNVQGKKLWIHGSGVYTNAAASLLNVRADLCTVSGCATGTDFAAAGCAVVTTNQANNVSNGQFSIDCYLTTTSTLGSSGTLMAKALVCAQLGAAVTAVQSCFQDQVLAVSAAVDETVNEFVNVSFKFSSSNAGNSAILNELHVEVLN